MRYFEKTATKQFKSFRLLILLACLGSFHSVADNIIVIPTSGFYFPFNRNEIKSLDTDFFTAKPLSKGTVSLGGQNRYYGEDLNYNSVQRAEWIEKCEPERTRGNKAFRKCFEQKKQQFQMELNKRFDEVNAKSSQPLKNQFSDAKPTGLSD